MSVMDWLNQHSTVFRVGLFGQKSTLWRFGREVKIQGSEIRIELTIYRIQALKDANQGCRF
jgi:hypothetical protein